MDAAGPYQRAQEEGARRAEARAREEQGQAQARLQAQRAALMDRLQQQRALNSQTLAKIRYRSWGQ